MSISLMTLVWSVSFPTHAQKLIALKLADWAHDDGTSVFPSRNKIADRCDVSVSTVKRTLGAFRDSGLLHLVREGGDGPKDTNEWRINVPLVEALAGGRARLEGDAGVVNIVWSDDAEGVQDEPLIYPQGVHPEQLRGPPASNKGVTSEPQTVNNLSLTVTSRAGASAASAAPSRSEGSAARAALLIRATDAPWNDWMRELPPDVAAQAREVGSIIAPSRWPKGNAEWVTVPGKPPAAVARDAQISVAKRIAGERDD